MWSLHEMKEWKWVQMVYVTWPRWPPCLYMVKTFKNLFLWHQKGRWPSNLLCNIGSSRTTKFVQMMTLGWPWPILQQSKIWPLWFLYGKCLSCKYPRNYWSLWGESWYIQSNKWVCDDLWQTKVKVIHWTLSKVTQIQHFQTSFFKIH